MTRYPIFGPLWSCISQRVFVRWMKLLVHRVLLHTGFKMTYWTPSNSSWSFQWTVSNFEINTLSIQSDPPVGDVYLLSEMRVLSSNHSKCVPMCHWRVPDRQEWSRHLGLEGHQVTLWLSIPSMRDLSSSWDHYNFWSRWLTDIPIGGLTSPWWVLNVWGTILHGYDLILKWDTFPSDGGGDGSLYDDIRRPLWPSVSHSILIRFRFGLKIRTLLNMPDTLVYSKYTHTGRIVEIDRVKDWLDFVWWHTVVRSNLTYQKLSYMSVIHSNFTDHTNGPTTHYLCGSDHFHTFFMSFVGHSSNWRLTGLSLCWFFKLTFDRCCT